MTSRIPIPNAVALLAILVPALLLACGDSGGLSRSDIQQIVQSELANNPAPVDQDSSREQVEKIVRETMAEGSDQGAEGAAMSMPRKSTPDQYTRYFVNKAIDKYESEGLDATLAFYNTSESMDGQWYVFIMSEDNTMLAHAANPDFVNRSISAAIGPNGYPAGEAVAAVADDDGEWFAYTFPNPASGALETKHSWMVLHDGIVFGSGWHEQGPRKSDAPAYTKSVVQQALNLYDALGLDAAIEYYTSKESVDGQWYVFIVDENGYTIAHHNPMFVRRDPSLRVDAAGYFYGDDLRSATETGKWVDYVLVNPESGEDRQKHTWVVRHDGLLFASGWYE